MKNSILILSFCFFLANISFAQNTNPTVTVLNIDTHDINYEPATMGNLVRIELDKLQLFQVTDRYDVLYLIEKNKLAVTNCYGKICLLEIGNTIHSDKMFTGSVEKIGETIVINFRMIDVKSATVEKSLTKEYLDILPEIQTMIRVTMREFFGLENDANLVNKLSKKETFDNAVNNPYQKRLRLDGPRMGYTYFTGTLANYLKAPKNEGGFDAMPAMFQFGYQFETQYLNEGNFQALFEFVPLVTGLDQGLFIPSLAVLNGLRSNKNGWELAFGPTVNFIQQADGTYVNGKWVLKSENNIIPGATYEKRIDSRGELYFHSGFVIVCGKSFRSGKLNIPVNAYFVPGKDGNRFGLSFGFNAKN
jgi:hypothetical protein